MNKIDLHPSSPTQPADAQLDISSLRYSSANISPESHRLLVLIPADSDYSAMTRQIWQLANTTDSTSVQLLSLCKDTLEEPGLRRGLAAMCALIREAGVSAETKVEFATNWVEVIKRNHQMGDLVVCFSEQRAGLLQRPLSQILQSNLNIRVYILSGATAQSTPRTNWFSQIMAWIGSVGIIVGSFLLQARITLLPQDWAQTTLLIFSVVGEIWLIWVWNNLFS
jgi:uncharacterized membrane protein YeaQ/YmgE (transglycosylase-associated protein family)